MGWKVHNELILVALGKLESEASKLKIMNWIAFSSPRKAMLIKCNLSYQRGKTGLRRYRFNRAQMLHDAVSRPQLTRSPVAMATWCYLSCEGTHMCALCAGRWDSEVAVWTNHYGKKRGQRERGKKREEREGKKSRLPSLLNRMIFLLLWMAFERKPDSHVICIYRAC